MIRTYRLYWNENSVGFYPADPKAPVDWQDIMLKLDEVPHGGTVRVFEVLARDPERYFARYCSAQVQPSAILLRHEVEVSPPDGVEWSDEEFEATCTWAEELGWNLDRDAEKWNLYGPRFFDDLPAVDVEVEVDDYDIENIDPEDIIDGDVDEVIEKLFERALLEQESGSPTARPAVPTAAKE
jgi:hypothetical protein